MSSQLNDEYCRVLDETRRAIEVLQRRGIAYAGLFAPMEERELNSAMRRLTVYQRQKPLGVRELELVTPPVWGRYMMVLSSDVDATRRRFAKRHGLGHVVAGHVSELHFMSTRRDYMSERERVADLFALADLTPAGYVEELRRSRMCWRAVRQDLCRTIRHFTIDWTEARVDDRATLRIALYREHGL